MAEERNTGQVSHTSPVTEESFHRVFTSTYMNKELLQHKPQLIPTRILTICHVILTFVYLSPLTAHLALRCIQWRQKLVEARNPYIKRKNCLSFLIIPPPSPANQHTGFYVFFMSQHLIPHHNQLIKLLIDNSLHFLIHYLICTDEYNIQICEFCNLKSFSNEVTPMHNENVNSTDGNVQVDVGISSMY